MNWFRNLKIAAKLGSAFGAVIALVLILGIFCMVQMARLNANVLDIGSNWIASTYLGKLRADVSTVRRWELNYFFATDKAGARQQMDDAMNAVLEDERSYEPTIATDEERKLYGGFRSAWDKHMAIKARIIELIDQGKTKEAGELSSSEGVPSFASVDQFIADDT